MKVAGQGKGMFGIFKKDSNQGNYTGEVRNDVAHGFGKLEFKDGSSYEGGFLFDEFHGEGEYTFSDGGVIKGKWTNGFFYEGSWEFINGDKYEGEFLTTKEDSGSFEVFMHGKGKLYRYGEGKWFTGFWKDNDLEESVDDWDVGDI